MPVKARCLPDRQPPRSGHAESVDKPSNWPNDSPGWRPTTPAIQDQLAVCHNNYANALDPKAIDEVLFHFQRAIEIRERIDPMRLPGVRIKLAESLINLGNALLAHSKTIGGRAELPSGRGDPALRRRQGSDPASPRWAWSARSNVNWSGMLHGLGRINEAVARADAGLSRLEPYVRLEPLDEQARELCLKLHGNRAHALAALGRHREAASEWTRVMELSPQPVPASYRIFLSFELLHSGELDGALTQTELVKANPADFPSRPVQPRLHFFPTRQGCEKQHTAFAREARTPDRGSHRRTRCDG